MQLNKNVVVIKVVCDEKYDSTLICPFWATVETWQSQMLTGTEGEQQPY